MVLAKSYNKGVKAMQNERKDAVLITQEACDYLRISRPTYMKCLYTGRIKGVRIGKGWRVLKSELDRFLQENNAKQEGVRDGSAYFNQTLFNRLVYDS